MCRWMDLVTSARWGYAKIIQSQYSLFFVPSSPHVLVSRPRLSTLLDEGLQRTLTVVSVPAGFGKTTLLSAWIQTLPKEATRVAWVSLDEGWNCLCCCTNGIVAYR
jgi:ATP/maltotriose-dependent transcriptional regulator MalT